MNELDVLIPTYRRPAALAVTLAGLTAQTLPRFRVVISDQTDQTGPDPAPDPFDGLGGEAQAAVRLLRARGRPVEVHRHLPRRGLAEQRHFLLGRARAPYACFLDDDVLLEPDVLARLLAAIREQRCGFVGMPLIGLSHLDDVRPHEQAIEPWPGPVQPERFGPQDARWQRHRLHNAANPWHVQQRLGATAEHPVTYKVAWVGGCVLYDTEKLRQAGGFSFWTRLPRAHCGEDVFAQQQVMASSGGCGLLPSGAYHLQLPTTVPDRQVDVPLVLHDRIEPAPGRSCR